MDTMNSSGPSLDLVGKATRAISAHIRDQELAPGDRLPSEVTMSQDFGVSRSVVREALSSLAALRIVEINPGRRAVVAQLDAAPMKQIFKHGIQTDQIGILDVYDARRAIEMRTAALAALHRTEQEAAEILAHAHAIAGGFDAPQEAMEHDLAMHLAIARASKNQVFFLMVGAFADVIRQAWPIGWRSRQSDAERQAMIDLHIELARAIDRGAPQAAAELMGRHFDDSVHTLIAAGIA